MTIGHVAATVLFARPDVPGDNIILSGTSGTPNSCGDSGTGAQAGWEFRTDGTVWQMRANSADTQFQDSFEWNDSQDTPTADYWIRFTEHAFTGDGSRVVNPGTSWLKVSGTGAANRGFECDDVLGTGPTEWTMKVEIAADAGGANIVATGYYKGSAEEA